MRHRLLFFLAAFFSAVLAYGFVPQISFNSQDRVVALRWPADQARSGITYWVNASSFPFPQADVLRVIDDSFGVWEAVETSFIAFRYRGTGSFRLSATDRRNVIIYDATGREIGAPVGAGVIAVTRVNWNDRGDIVDADLVFNGRDFQFSLDPNRTSRGKVGLQDVMTHELGHFLGLDHTPLQGSPSVRPTMFPYLFGEERSLELDDMAGASSLYPSSSALSTGTISGRVTHPDGRGVFGAHVVAYKAGTGEFAVGALSGSVGGRTSIGPDGDGEYRISGLPPGDYQVAIEPLTGSVTSENLGGIFHDFLDTDFFREFYDNVGLRNTAKVLQVGAGRAVGGINFTLGMAVPGFPFLQDPVLPVNTPDPSGPYRVQARITDDGGVASARLIYRVDGGAWQPLPLQPGNGDLFFADIPGQAPGTVVEYRLSARDMEGNETTFPLVELPPLRFEVLSLSGDPVLYVALRRSRVLSVIDTGPGREVARIPVGNSPLSVALTPDERYLFVANTGEQEGTEDRVTVVETATHRVAAHIRVGLAPLDLTVSADGSRVYVTNSRARSVSVLDVAGLREIRKLSVATAGEGPFGIAVAPDNRRLYVTDIDANRVLVLDPETGALLDRIAVVASPRSLALSPDGGRLYVAGFEGGISVVDTGTGGVIRTIDTAPAQGIFRIAPSTDGKTLFATDQFDANLLIVDPERGRVTSALPALSGGRNTRDLVVSADGRFVYVANQDSNDLLTFDTATLQIVGSLKVEDGPRGIAVRGRPTDLPSQPDEAASADFDGSGQVDFADFLLFVKAFGTTPADTFFEARFDLSRDDRVDFDDFILFARVFGLAVTL